MSRLAARHSPRWITLVGTLFLAVAGARADEPIKNIEQFDLEDLLGTVTAVSRKEESVLTAPATVTVIDAEHIRLSSATTLADLLRTIPGVQVLEVAPGNYLVSLRGAGGVTGNNVVVLLDGNPLNAIVDGNVDWGAIPVDLQSIDRVEVVRGPVSTIYGPNAYTGVINVVLVPPSDKRAAGSARLGIGVDSSGHVMELAGANVSGTRGIVASRLTLAGRYDPLDTRGPALALGGGTLLVDVKLPKFAKLSLEVAGSYNQRNALDHLVLESLAQRSTFLIGTLRFTISHLPSVLDTLEIWARGRYQRVDTGAEFKGFSYNNLDGADGQAGFDQRFAFAHKIYMGVGGNVGLTRVAAPFLHPDETGRVRPFYGFQLNGGVDFERVSLSVAGRGDNSSPGGLNFSGRGSVIYHRSIWALRLTAGSAFRDPTYVEVGGRFIDPRSRLILLEGTPGLRAPRINAYELGAHIIPHPRVGIHPAIYVAQMNELMIEDFRPVVRRTFLNENGSRWIMGGEVEIDWRIREELTLEGKLATLGFLATPSGGTTPTLGDPAQNSSVTAWLGAHSTLLNDRLGLALGLAYVSHRHYNLQAGIPPVALDVEAPQLFRIEAAADYRLTRKVPVWIALKLRSNLPNNSIEAPFPGAASLGTVVFGSVEYRGQ